MKVDEVKKASDLKKKSGIYLILCTSTMEGYIGSSIDLLFRLKEHLVDLRKNKHSNQHLQNTWNKYEKSDFEILIIEFCTKDKLIEREQFYINLYQTHYKKVGFNKACAQQGNLGYKHTEETKNKIKLSWQNPEIKQKRVKGMHDSGVFETRKITHNKLEFKQKASEITKQYFSDPVKRQEMSEIKKEYFSDPANRKKISEATSKAMNTPEVHKKLSVAIKKFNVENPERYKEIKAAQKAVLSSDEQRQANSKRSKELWQDPNHREKVLAARKDMYTDEVKAKMSKKAQAFWDDPVKAKELMIKRSNITQEQFEQLKELHKLGYKQSQIAKVLGCKKEAVGRICRGESKLYILPKIEDGEIQLVDINVWEDANKKLGIDMNKGQSLHLSVKF